MILYLKSSVCVQCGYIAYRAEKSSEQIVVCVHKCGAVA